MGSVVMQALLEEWRNELARKPLVMSEREACAVLGVQQEEGGQAQEGPLSEDALKAAHRSVMTTTSLCCNINNNHLLLLCLSMFSSWIFLSCIYWYCFCALEYIRSKTSMLETKKFKSFVGSSSQHLLQTVVVTSLIASKTSSVAKTVKLQCMM